MALTPGAFRWTLGDEDATVLGVLNLPPNVQVAFAPVGVTPDRVLAMIPVAPLDEAGVQVPAAPSGEPGRVEFATADGTTVTCVFIMLDATVFATSFVYCFDPYSEQAQFLHPFVEDDVTNLPLNEDVREAALTLEFLSGDGKDGYLSAASVERPAPEPSPSRHGGRTQSGSPTA